MTKKYYDLTIKRYTANREPACWEQSFKVPVEKPTTVLQALQHVYEHEDPLLAFDYSCRYGRCGLCGVELNGKPVLACMTFIREGMNVISPLSNLRPLRDLVVDREPLEQLIKQHCIYHGGFAHKESGKLPSPGCDDPFRKVKLPDQLGKLQECVNCLCCHASCPNVGVEAAELEQFAGPYIFLRLAILQFDPGDDQDRLAQASSLGIEKCADCRKCYCPQGVPIYNKAISALLEMQGLN